MSGVTGAGIGFQFRVLGPLEVWLDGSVVGIGGVRQRALLAMLLLNANRVVSRDRLIDELLPNTPADRADQNLRVHISRLRASLSANGGGPRLAARAPGYLLTVNPGELDLQVFEELLAQGRRASAERDFELAARLLREAEGLWRGRPLADLEFEPFARIEVERLEELRLETLEERIDAELALGEHAKLCAELESLVAEHSLRERLQSQLMLALYRAGRQSDALAVYRDASELLRDHLGLEPSRALRDIELAILRQDPSLDGMPRTPPPGVGSLPLAATPFVGRTRELAEVTALLRTADTRLLTLTGAGGSGKTRLALRIAEARTRDYRDGVWFVAFEDISDPDLIAPMICQALGLAEQPGLTPTRRLLEWLGERRLLLLLDNLEQLVDGTALLGDLLAQCPRTTLLVTSRVPLRLAGEQLYEVPVLEYADAIELFTARARAMAPRLNIHPDLAGRICERVDRLPLAIELAAARTKALPPTEILARLEARLPVLSSGPRDAPRRQQTLQATIEWSYDLLTSQEQRLFERLAVFAGGCTLAAAETVCNADLDTVQALTDRSLATVDDKGRYAMLQTLREYALEKLKQRGETEHLRRRHARWFMAVLHADTPVWYRPEAPLQASLLVAERENFRAALEWAEESGQWETVAQLAVSLNEQMWIRQGQLNEAERWLRVAQEHRMEFALSLRAFVLGAASVLAERRGDLDGAVPLCEQALAIHREIGNSDGICWELIGRAILAYERGDLVGARTVYEEVILHARQYDVPHALPEALAGLGELAIQEGRLGEAKARCQEGLAIAEEISSARGAINMRLNLAHVASLENRYNDALDLARKALTDALDHEHSIVAALAVMQIAWGIAQQGQPERSARLLGAALGFHQNAGANLLPIDRDCERQTYKILRDQIDADRFQALLEEGRKMPLEEAAREALIESPGTDMSIARIPTERQAISKRQRESFRGTV